MRKTSHYTFSPSFMSGMNLPLNVRGTGFVMARHGDKGGKTLRNHSQLFWTIHGKAEFIIGRQKTVVEEQQTILIPPGQKKIKWRVDDIWQCRFLSFGGSLHQKISEAFHLPKAASHHAGRCPQELFEKLEKLLQKLEVSSQMQASSAAYEILGMACESGNNTETAPPSLSQHCIQLISEEFHNYDVNVAWLAMRLGVHRCTLQKVFRQDMAVSPGEYLNACRVEKALEMLRATILPIQEISKKCGFWDANYFSRKIRKATGCSPREIRQNKLA